MRKKILICLCTFALAISLVACGSKEETYGGYPAEAYEQSLMSYMNWLTSLTDANFEEAKTYYEQQGQESMVTLVEDYADCYADMGEFVDYGDFSVEKSGKTITATLECDTTGRDIRMVFVYKANDVEAGPTSMNVERIYTKGEIMQKAGLNTLMGILIVFAMLIFMSGIIKLFEIIPKLEKKFKEKDEVSVSTPATVAPVETAKTDDLELVAVIAAAIAASTGASTDSFVVRSIKKR